MPKPKQIELNDGEVVIPILYEDRSVLALDKPAGWMLAPDSWDQTGRNLQLALQSSLNARDHWAQSRNLKYIRFIHRLDAETTGVTLFAKSLGALSAYSELFENRSVEKFYIAVIHGTPKETEWACSLPLAADPSTRGKMIAIEKNSRRRIPAADIKEAETHFTVLQTVNDTSLILARPMTGRTHQIRVHLASTGHAILGDALYGAAVAALSKGRQKMALRAAKLAFPDPFQRRMIYIEAPMNDFLVEYGFPAEGFSLRKISAPTKVAS